MRRRDYIPLKTRLAATLCEILTDDGTGKLVKVIPHEDAVKMTEDQVLSLFHFDHAIYHAQGGADAFWNLTPTLIPEHREKTRKRDIPQIAKTRRIEQREAEFRARLLAKHRGEPRPPNRWPKSSFQKRRAQS
ncbi:hypothetical protein [Bradyrhizobium liaoningense]|uniref:hypothetical protein n=1 Tax=Bradyrhizobium liaoningense TaxID=43992 RepID=UPI000558F857|nr:hypothetical protein [Bradyrhizobium liaoningense]